MSANFCFNQEKLFFNENLILFSNNRFNEIFKNNQYLSDYKNIREIDKKLISKEPIFYKIMKKIHKKFEFIVKSTDLKFEKLWLVHSMANNVNKEKLPYIPHIDKTRYLKAMVYLHDIKLENGPIHLGKLKSTINIEQIRKQLPKNYKETQLNRVYDYQIGEILKPMIGKARDVVFFDTNTPHKAGEIKKGHYRKVLRFDFSRPSFNTKISIISRLMSALK